MLRIGHLDTVRTDSEMSHATGSTSKEESRRLELFMDLSRALCGLEQLEAKPGLQYLCRLLESPFQPGLARLLDAFATSRQAGMNAAAAVQAALNEDDLRAAATQMVLLWFTSAMQESADPAAALQWGDPDQYFGALVWQLIGAHPPGLSGGYFGHWRYAPENEPG
jgi:hypothetical protein